MKEDFNNPSWLGAEAYDDNECMGLRFGDDSADRVGRGSESSMIQGIGYRERDITLA